MNKEKVKLTDEELKNISGGVKNDDIPHDKCDTCGSFIVLGRCPMCDKLIALPR